MKLVIFDMDGTTVDTIETIAYYTNNALGKCGLSTLTNEHYKKFTGEGMRVLIERCVEAVGADSSYVEKVEKIYKDAYDADFMYLTKPYDGIVDMLKKLKSMGVKTAVVSNKPQELAEQVSEKLFGDLMDETRGAKAGVPLKPDPVQVLEVIEGFGVSKNECLYIGDTATDIKTAKNAGLYSIGVLWGFRDFDELSGAGADMIISDPADIARAAESENIGLL